MAHENEKPCPSCGYCPTCGRSNKGTWGPYWGQYQPTPYWYYWYYSSGGNTHIPVTSLSYKSKAA